MLPDLRQAKPFDGTGDYDFEEEREEFIARVTAQGYRVVFPGDNQLQIDIDSAEQYAAFDKAVLRWNRNAEPFAVEEHPSMSGLPRRHITLTLPYAVTPWQRIALQAAFGSDPVRELLSAVRLQRRDPHPTLFVED